MGNFHIKSVVLGVGIGVLLTSILGIIYSLGTTASQTISDDEIMARARQLGMVENVQSILIDDESNEKLNNHSRSNNNLDNQQSKEQDQDSEKLAEVTGEEEIAENGTMSGEVSFVIESGATSHVVADILLEHGLIDDKQLFLIELERRDAITRIKAGSYNLKRNLSIEEIIEIIT